MPQTAGIGGWHPLSLQLAMCPTSAALFHFNPISIPSSTSYFLEYAEEFTHLSHLSLPIFLYEC